MLQRMIKTGLCITLAGNTVFGAQGLAAPLEAAVDAQVKTDQAAAKSQRRVDALSDETAELLAEYRQVTASLDGFHAYNHQLERLIHSQKEEFASLQRQLTDIEVTQREIVPLMLRMVSVLEQFVALDTPFLPVERQTRIEQLKALMDRSDVSLSEKYRRIMEAYQVEAEYGRTIEAYQGTLKAEGKPRTVDFLRIGRVGLFFQTLDGKATGRWDVHERRWVALPDDYQATVAKGLRIARQQAPPDLLLLPVQAPEATRQ